MNCPSVHQHCQIHTGLKVYAHGSLLLNGSGLYVQTVNLSLLTLLFLKLLDDTH